MDPAYQSGGPTYEIRVHAERRVYNSVPADVVRELTAASGVEDAVAQPEGCGLRRGTGGGHAAHPQQQDGDRQRLWRP